MMTIVLMILAVTLVVGCVLVAYGTLTRNDWGINLAPTSCPRCHTPRPVSRAPQSLHHALWGGGFCLKCGTEIDKWGREIKS